MLEAGVRRESIWFADADVFGGEWDRKASVDVFVCSGCGVVLRMGWEGERMLLLFFLGERGYGETRKGEREDWRSGIVGCIRGS